MHKNVCNRIAILLAAGLLLAGCAAWQGGGAAPLTPAPATPTAAPPAATHTPEAKTVVVYARGMDETESTVKLLEAFNAQSDAVTVRYQELASDSMQRYQQILTSLAAASTEIDVFDADIVWPAGFAASGFVSKVDAYVERDGLQLGDYWPGTISALTYKESLWGLPKTASAGVLYYRTDLMSEPPQTWEALIEAAESADALKYGFVMNGAVNESLVCIALELIYAHGGRVLDADGEIAMVSEQTIAGLNCLRELYALESTPPNIGLMTDNDAIVSFLQGDVLMMRSWPHAWAIGRYAENAVTGKFAIAPLPAGGGDLESASTLSGVALLMNAKTRNADAAWAFMRYAAGTEGQEILAVSGGRVPALRAVMQRPAVIKSNPHFGEQSFIHAVENAVPRVVTPFYMKLSGVMQDELRKFLLYEQDAKITAAKIEARVRDIFNETGRLD